MKADTLTQADRSRVIGLLERCGWIGYLTVRAEEERTHHRVVDDLLDQHWLLTGEEIERLVHLGRQRGTSSEQRDFLWKVCLRTKVRFEIYVKRRHKMSRRRRSL
jgi:hypothetical protein